MTLRPLFSVIVTTAAFTAPCIAAPFMPPSDVVEARELCDNTDLRPVEGLWSYPEDDVTVLVFRNDEKKGVYDIYVVEAADCSLSPGMKLGELRSSADPDKFNLRLFTAVKKGNLSLPVDAVATYSGNKESISVKKTSGVRIRINPTRLLPSFWRLATINIKQNEAAPEGMIRLYPSYDGNGSSRRAPRYL